jgi:hypothetical protein
MCGHCYGPEDHKESIDADDFAWLVGSRQDGMCRTDIALTNSGPTNPVVSVNV